jgi:deoxyribodipyrimidine photo-lyase
MSAPSIVWFRDDLRVADNPALHEAAQRGEPVVCLYILDDASPGLRPLGGAARWWLHHSLEALASSLRDAGLELTLRRGAAADVIDAVVAETGAKAVFWNRRYGEAERTVDAGIKAALRAAGVEARSSQASLMFEPWTVLTGQGAPYRVFTPFYRSCLAQPEPRHPLPVDDDVSAFAGVTGDELGDWALLPTTPEWAGGLREAWTPGEKTALKRLRAFLADELSSYVAEQDLPAQDATSGLSPYLRWGEISPFQVWHETRSFVASLDRRTSEGARAADGASAFLRQLVWREFSYHLLFHWPQITHSNMRPAFDDFPWAEPTDVVMEAWQMGRTGIPLVDAGMRELWQTGIMHNRVRMVVASFLVKNLRIDWREGERWFWDTLVDADPAANAVNWQWVAGSGVDAAPYFRVFNPELQATKFDPRREYIRRFVPDIDAETYPPPLVDLKESRKAALDAYASISKDRALGEPGASGD